MPTPSSPALTTASFLAHNRGGGWYSEAVSQRVAAWVALTAHRSGISPSTITLAGAALGIVTSVALVLLAPATAAGPGSAVLIGLAVGLGWQFAYVLDCADGQLARATGRTSAAGARLDILCDVGVQISVVAALTAVTAVHTPEAPAWLSAVFAGTWMVNLVTSALAGGPASGSLITGGGTTVRLVKLIRDYGAVIAACALVVAIAPEWTAGIMVVLSTVNGLFLLAVTAQAAKRALASTDRTAE